MKRVLSLMSIASLFAACSEGTTGPTDVTMVSMANPSLFVANTLTVPMDRMQFGMDLNGDGKVDNQLGNIIGALSANDLDTQEGVDNSICEGAVILLLKMTSGDATYQNDDATGALLTVKVSVPSYLGPSPAWQAPSMLVSSYAKELPTWMSAPVASSFW
jgi:hypothetical protein